MERKPQHQTLSIRISDTLREFLERSKQVISNGRGESVSTSDVAKILLESAKDDRLDFRLEVAELQQSATKSMWKIRRKWEQKQDLSRAEWIFLAQYIQVACEEVSGDAAMPTPAAYAVLLEAVLAVRSLRGNRGVELDRYYLGNIGTQEEAAFNDRQIDPDLLPRVTARWVQQLRESPSPPKPSFAGRNFYVAIRDEELPDIVALNRTLFSYMDMLFRLAARGHWMREHQPVRSLRGPSSHYGLDPCADGYGVSAEIQRDRRWRFVAAHFYRSKRRSVSGGDVPRNPGILGDAGASIAGPVLARNLLLRFHAPGNAGGAGAVPFSSTSGLRHDRILCGGMAEFERLVCQGHDHAEVAEVVRGAFSPLRRTLAVGGRA